MVERRIADTRIHNGGHRCLYSVADRGHGDVAARVRKSKVIEVSREVLCAGRG